MTTTTSYVCDLRNAPDAREAGHKAANLAVLMRAGFPVPDGLVLLADALDHALDQAGFPGRFGRSGRGHRRSGRGRGSRARGSSTLA